MYFDFCLPTSQTKPFTFQHACIIIYLSFHPFLYQRRLSGVLLYFYCSLLYSLVTRSHLEPGSRCLLSSLVFSKLQGSYCLYYSLPLPIVELQVRVATLSFLHGSWGTELLPSCLCSKNSYPLSPLIYVICFKVSCMHQLTSS